MKNHHDIDKAYVSPFDRFLHEFDATHHQSTSQLKEIKKHQRIAACRDGVLPGQGPEEIWTEF